MVNMNAHVPYDPYRAHLGRSSPKPLGPATRWIFGFVAFAMIVGIFGGIALIVAACVHTNAQGAPNDDMMVAGILLLLGAILLIYVQIGVAAFWVHKAWSWLPMEQRYTTNWKGWITPGQAALFLLIPYFHWYWMFVVNLGLCDALERMRVQHPAGPAPRGLAMTAMIVQLVQMFVPLPVSPILWLVYMTRVERIMREMAASRV
jgi:hypothetical protein